MPSVMNQFNKVISISGGSVLSLDNKKIKLSSGLIVALISSPKTLIDRLKNNESRPLLSSDKEEQLLKMM